jgi:hypothetical protein
MLKVIPCEYCGKKAELIITPMMQPSYHHYSCRKCKSKKEDFMVVVDPRRLEEIRKYKIIGPFYFYESILG